MSARLPIRWKLTLWYALLLAAALALFGSLLYFGVRRSLYENFSEQVRNEAAFALTGISELDGELTLAPEAVARLEDDDHFVRVIDANGVLVLDTSAGLGGVSLDQEQINRAQTGETQFSTYHGAAEPIGIVTTPIVLGKQVTGVLQVGTSRGDTDEVLQTILIALAIAGPLVMVISAGGGYYLAGRVLAPVDSITAMARKVSADDLHSRIDLDLPNDELGHLAGTFNDMLDRIETSFERQRRFTSDAAHELRTPLAAMRSEIDISLARPRSNEEYRTALRGLDIDVDRMTRLTATLLTLARSDAGHLELKREMIDLQHVVRIEIDRFAATADQRGITLDDASTSAPCFIDPNLISQLISNLIENAIAHTPAGESITVGCRVGADIARLWVEDTGAGVPAEHQPHLFDRFYRVDSGRSRGEGGAGLGLSIVRAISEAHGGTVELTSEPGLGTQVVVDLPCQFTSPSSAS